MLNQLRTAGFGLIILTLVLTFNGPALAHEHGGAIEARQREYEHGYRDGYHHGRDDRARNATRESEDYEHGDRGHQPYIGSKDNYKKGYREGHVAGYNDGYDGVPGRFAEIYGLEPLRANPDAPYTNDRDDIFVRRGFSVSDVAFDVGYRLQAGRYSTRADPNTWWPAEKFRAPFYGGESQSEDKAERDSQKGVFVGITRALRSPAIGYPHWPWHLGLDFSKSASAGFANCLSRRSCKGEPAPKAEGGNAAETPAKRIDIQREDQVWSRCFSFPANPGAHLWVTLG